MLLQKRNFVCTSTNKIVILVVVVVVVVIIREVTANRPGIIIKNKKEKTCTRGNTRTQKCRTKGSGKEVKIQAFKYRDTTNVEPEMYDSASDNWSHWNSNKKLKEKFGNCIRKTFNRFTTKDSYTWNITHNRGNTAV